MILVSDDSKGPGGGRYLPLREQALSGGRRPSSKSQRRAAGSPSRWKNSLAKTGKNCALPDHR